MTSKLAAISFLVSSTLLVGLALGAVRPPIANSSATWTADSVADPQTHGQPPSAAEMRARTEKLMANQHADDQALELYQRVERYVDRSDGTSDRITDDKTYRVVPTGAGTQKILLRDDDKAEDRRVTAGKCVRLQRCCARWPIRITRKRGRRWRNDKSANAIAWNSSMQ